MEEERGNMASGGAGSEPPELQTTKGGATKALPSCLAHHPEVSLEPPDTSP